MRHDGLLLNTEAVQKTAMRAVAVDLGWPLADDLLLGMVGVDRARNKVALRDRLGADFPIDTFYAEVDRRFAEVIAAGAPLKPGVHDLLAELDALRLPRAVATSTVTPWAQQRLASAGLLARFDAVVTASDVARTKPAPDPYLQAAAAIGACPQRCLALDDSVNGVRSALAAGLVTIMVPDLVGPTPDIAERVAATFGSLGEVAQLLRRELSAASTDG